MDTVWTFETANFRIALEVEPEEMDPADSFQFEEDIQAVRNGDVAWFCCTMSVYKNGHRIGRDDLGGCAYKSVRDFYKGEGRNGYFRDMVRTAIADARQTLGLDSLLSKHQTKGSN